MSDPNARTAEQILKGNMPLGILNDKEVENILDAIGQDDPVIITKLRGYIRHRGPVEKVLALCLLGTLKRCQDLEKRIEILENTMNNVLDTVNASNTQGN